MLTLDPTLYLIVALLYGAQARDAIRHGHVCRFYLGLTAVHLCLALKKLPIFS